MEWIAKTRPYRSLKEHTADVLERWHELNRLYPGLMGERDWELLRIAAATHDLGKVNTRFQNRLRALSGIPTLPSDGLNEAYRSRGINQIPHGFLSPAFLDWVTLREKFTEDELKLLIRVIFRHHLREFVKEDLIEDVIENDPCLRMLDFSFLEGMPVTSPIDDYLQESEILKRIHDMDDQQWYRWVCLKGTLNRLDYSASAGLPVEEIPPPGSRLLNSMDGFFRDRQPRPVQQYMKEFSGKNVVVIASTGVGKTEAALLWIGERKGFYTLPIRTAINAMYERIHCVPSKERDNALGYKSVAVLHSDAIQVLFNEILNNYETQEEAALEAQNQYERAKLLSAPLTICTVDQLFKFVFKHEGCESLLATLSVSSVVIDEIQMYSPSILAYIIEGLRHISNMGGRFAIITATFPPLLEQIMRECGIEFEKPAEPFLSKHSVRHRIAFISSKDFDIDEIARNAETKKVLVIVNTVKRAQEIYDRLNDIDVPVKLLHSRFLRRHRAILEEAILNFTNLSEQQNLPGVWVTTQVVEASLDVDFDILYTEMCTAESLLQRMGRIWRRRDYDYDGPPNVYILNNLNGVPHVVDPELYKFGVQAFMDRDGDFLSEQEKMIIIDEIYNPTINKEILRSQYYVEIKKKVQVLSVPPGRLTKKDADKQFRDISSITIIPESVYRQLESKGFVDEWSLILSDSKNSLDKRIRARLEMMEWSVSIPIFGGRIRHIDRQEAFFNGSGIRRSLMNYDFDEEKLTGKGLTSEVIDDDPFCGG